MKIVFFGYDLFYPCLAQIAALGHELSAIFTGPLSIHTQRIHQFATRNAIPVFDAKPSLSALSKLVDASAELFLCAEYPWKIPIPDGLRYGINLHPTMLPEGRGPTPIPWLFLQYPQHAGLSIHKLSNRFDAGDILLQQSIRLEPDDNYDRYGQKLVQLASDMQPAVLSNIATLYRSAQPQAGGSEWPMIGRQQRTIAWEQPIAQILKTVRAFGSLGSFAAIAGTPITLFSANGIAAAHELPPGTIFERSAERIVVAAVDGFIIISHAITTD